MVSHLKFSVLRVFERMAYTSKNYCAIGSVFKDSEIIADKLIWKIYPVGEKSKSTL